MDTAELKSGMALPPHLIILGIRGLPASHGGFETFAERLAPYFVESGWQVTVYCQGSASGKRSEDEWNGIKRIHIPVRQTGSLGTIEFDLKCALDVESLPGTLLTLGYNTGFISAWLRFRGRVNLINMDGLEWKRAKYSWAPRSYLWINERIAAWSGTKLIADHPVIADHLATRVSRSKIVTIPYGSDKVIDADPIPLTSLGLTAGKFFTLIARAVPENLVLEIVKAFSSKPRGVRLALLGQYDKSDPYQAQVLSAASPEVIFTGGIYDRDTLAALRCHSIAYLHGHQVGGTNPSLVEALGAGNPIIAHDNAFNRWVAGDAGLYFADEHSCATAIEEVLNSHELRSRMSNAARLRWHNDFTWPAILERYISVIENVSCDLTDINQGQDSLIKAGR
jgi:glycosyltransferase involved in cell wall biosynthesis